MSTQHPDAQSVDRANTAARWASRQAKSHLKVAGKMLGLAIGMFGFGYAMVPLYDIICDITGLNGKTGRVSIESVVEVSAEQRAARDHR